MRFAHHQHVVQTCAAHAAQHPLADRIRTWSLDRRPEYLNTAADHDAAWKWGPYFASLSRMRYFGASPNGVASRSGWATHSLVGERVTLTWTMRHDPSSVMKQAKRGRKKRSWTCRTSQGQLACA